MRESQLVPSPCTHVGHGVRVALDWDYHHLAHAADGVHQLGPVLLQAVKDPGRFRHRRHILFALLLHLLIPPPSSALVPALEDVVDGLFQFPGGKGELGRMEPLHRAELVTVDDQPLLAVAA